MPKQKRDVAAELEATFDDVDGLFALAQSRPLDLPLQNKIINRLYTLVKPTDERLWWDLWQWQRGRSGGMKFWLAPSREKLDPRLRGLALTAMRAGIPKKEGKPEAHAGAFSGLSNLVPDVALADLCREAVLALPLGSYERFNGVAQCLRKHEGLPGRREIQLLGARRFLDEHAEIAQAYAALSAKKLYSEHLDPLWAVANCPLADVLSDCLAYGDEAAADLANRIMGITTGLMVLRDALGDAYRVVGARRLTVHLPTLPHRFQPYVDLRGEWQKPYYVIAPEIAIAWARLDPPGAKKTLSEILVQRGDSSAEDVATRASCLAGLLALPTPDEGHVALAAKMFGASPGPSVYALLRGVTEGRLGVLEKEVAGIASEGLWSRLRDRIDREKQRALAASTQL